MELAVSVTAAIAAVGSGFAVQYALRAVPRYERRMFGIPELAAVAYFVIAVALVLAGRRSHGAPITPHLLVAAVCFLLTIVTVAASRTESAWLRRLPLHIQAIAALGKQSEWEGALSLAARSYGRNPRMASDYATSEQLVSKVLFASTLQCLAMARAARVRRDGA